MNLLLTSCGVAAIIVGLIRSSATRNLVHLIAPYYAVLIGAGLIGAAVSSRSSFLLSLIVSTISIFIVQYLILRTLRFRPLQLRQLRHEHIASTVVALVATLASISNNNWSNSLLLKILFSIASSLTFYLIALVLAVFREDSRLRYAAARSLQRDTWRTDFFDYARSLLALAIAASCLAALSGVLH